ncbi:SPOR domain-containing protein [Prevotella sp.]|jgi:Sporulation related domain.|uniref:SPOR domain-containing protein n=1 Tax=Prevotella sp. TaxID=59823 RepID=UPI003DA3DC33
MNKFVISSIIALGISVNAGAQTYLDHLKKNVAGKGNVTVTQSKEIDELVNGKKIQTQQKADNTVIKEKKAETSRSENNRNRNNIKPQNVIGDSAKHHNNNYNYNNKNENIVNNEKSPEKRENTTKQKSEPVRIDDEEEFDIPTIDMRKKVMRGSRKITGFRVQAFSGGNSRNDRMKAEQARTTIKLKYPEEPIYVHFYSPHWICRVGNYRSFQEAKTMLTKVKALGYRQACIVKGTISIQY